MSTFLISLLVVAIFYISAINLIRIVLYMIGADAHDVRAHRAKRNRQEQNKPYQPVITIVVPAHNEEAVIIRCLRSIYDNKYGRKQVIVVDDGSTDGTYEKVRYFKRKHKLNNLRILRQINGGKASAINNGIRQARGSLVMVLDSDSYLDSKAVQEAVRYFEDKRIVMTAANIKIIDDGTWLGLVQKFEYLISYRMKRAQTMYNIEYIIGGIGSTFRKSIVKKVGYYDTDTMTEDIDFTMKILRQGNKTQRVAYASNAIAYTESVMTFKQLISQRFRWKFGRMQTFVKNYKMFFNTHSRYDKRLTMIQLPFALFSELSFLLEPIITFFLLWIIIWYGDAVTLLSAYGVTTAYIALNIIAEETETLKSKLKLLMLAPIQYPLFFVLSAVEYIALVMSLKRVRQLFAGGGTNKWTHVDRSAKPL